jgi:hypothetical protein
MPHLRYKNNEEFEKKHNSGDIELSKVIVGAILNNLNTRKKHVYIFTIELIEEEEVYDLTCSPEDFLLNLQKNLEIYIKHEEYEGCRDIQNAINHLKKI